VVDRAGGRLLAQGHDHLAALAGLGPGAKADDLVGRVLAEGHEVEHPAVEVGRALEVGDQDRDVVDGGGLERGRRLAERRGRGGGGEGGEAHDQLAAG
jgi:hypothetical protein